MIMKHLLFVPLLVVACLFSDTAMAQPPYVRNILDTNAITLGAGLSLSAGGVLSATGTGTPGGNTGNVQFNQGGAFAGTNELFYSRSTGLLTSSNTSPSAGFSAVWTSLATNTMTPTGIGITHPGTFTIGTSNTTRWIIDVDGRLYPSASGGTIPDIGQAVAAVRSITVQTGMVRRVHAQGGYFTNDVVIEPHLGTQTGTNTIIDGAVGNSFTNFFSANSSGSGVTNVLIQNIQIGQTIVITLVASNGVNVNFPQFAAADYIGGAIVTPKTNCLTTAYITRLDLKTNITVFTGGLEFRSGWGNSIVTNYAAGTATMGLTNRITYAPTNGTTLHVDWTVTEFVIVPNLLETNLVLIPTNMVTARPLTLICLSNSVTYNISISNAAGTRVIWPFGSTNSGNAALTKTNLQQYEFSLLPLTNGISAVFGRSQ
jgi:hypothetical protein